MKIGLVYVQVVKFEKEKNPQLTICVDQLTQPNQLAVGWADWVDLVD